MQNRKIRLGEIDREILMVLYRFNWAYDYHISALVGESQAYVKGRLKQLAQAGLIGRKILLGNEPAANYIKSSGMKLLGLEPRKIHEPVPKTCVHDRACADLYVALTISTRIQDDKRVRSYSFNQIITEKDLFCARKNIATGHHKKNGQMIYKPVDLAHRPDGYLITKAGSYIALEAELTPKSKKSKLFANIDSNVKYFQTQWWFTDKDSIKKAILSHAQDLGITGSVKVYSMSQIHNQVLRYVAALPKSIAKKDGRNRTSLVSLDPPVVIPTEDLPKQLSSTNHVNNSAPASVIPSVIPKSRIKLEA